MFPKSTLNEFCFNFLTIKVPIIPKHSSIGVRRKRCLRNRQPIYRKTPMPKCDFNKVALQLYWNHTSAWVFSCRFAAYFQNTFSWEFIWRTASRQLIHRAINHLLSIWGKHWPEAVTRRCSLKKVCKNFAKFTGKHLYQSLFLNKVADHRPATSLKRNFGTGVLIFKNTFFYKSPSVASSDWLIMPMV